MSITPPLMTTKLLNREYGEKKRFSQAHFRFTPEVRPTRQLADALEVVSPHLTYGRRQLNVNKIYTCAYSPARQAQNLSPTLFSM